MIGIGHSRIARITSPVILVNPISSRGLHLDQLADDLVDVAAAAEPLALAADHQHLHAVVVRQLGEQVAQVGVATRRSAGSASPAGSG